MNVPSFPWWLRYIVGTHHFICFLNTQAADHVYPWFPLDMFILRITSDINDVPQVSFALSSVPMCHTLCLCFFQRSTQLYGSQNKYFEYPSYLCSMPCLTFSMHEYPQMTRRRGQKSEIFFPVTTRLKLEGFALKLLKYSLWFLEMSALVILSNTDFWKGE